MNKQILTLAFAATFTGFAMQATAQPNKEKKSRYYQNNAPEQEFNIQGFFVEDEQNEVEKPVVEKEYDVKISRDEKDDKYKREKRVIEKPAKEEVIYTRPKTAEETEAEQNNYRPARQKGYYSSTGKFIPYDNGRGRYDRYYTEGSGNNNNYVPPARNERYSAPPVARREEVIPAAQRKEKEIKMTNKENEYQTTVVKRRYTNLDVLADDLDLAKIQRPVFKGICSEAAHDVDAIIVNKNMTSLEKNYHLKQCYILRDKRLRETLDDDQYKKFLRIKDADEYLILTRDPELKDGVYK